MSARPFYWMIEKKFPDNEIWYPLWGLTQILTRKEARDLAKICQEESPKHRYRAIKLVRVKA